MTCKSKQKGSNFERSIVNLLKSKGVNSKRAYASNGESLGLHKDVDVVTYLDEISISGEIVKAVDLKLQCKIRAKLPEYLGLSKEVDAALFRMDRGDTYIMMRFDDFIEKYL